VQEAGPVGPSGSAPDDADDLLVFVERLAAAAQDHPATAVARDRITAIIRGGAVPPGIRRLAEGLAASLTDPTAPAPRTSTDSTPAGVARAVRHHPLVVLEDAAPGTVATTVAELVADGRRVVVAADTPAELEAVRRGVPGPVLDALPTLDPADLRELRRLQAGTTAAARARTGQRLPPAAALPLASEVERLCAQAGNARASAPTVVAGVLAGVDPTRREAVTSVARGVIVRLDALRNAGDQPWCWELLGHLIHSRHRAPFDRTLEELAQAIAILRRKHYATPVEFLSPLRDDAVDLLCDYHQFLVDGGRVRRYFPTALQREVDPLLRSIRVGGREPENEADLLRVIGQLELRSRLRRIEAGCVQMRVPPPQRPEDLQPLEAALQLVAAAARSVASLRHDVLFLAEDSPLQVPDVPSAGAMAAAILDYVDHGSSAESAGRLDAMADELAARAPAGATAPEHQQAVDALRGRDPAAYAAAVDALGAARRQQRDEQRRAELLEVLRGQAPAVAEAWSAGSGGGVPGLACFMPCEALLRGLPGPDSADVVVVLGAARLGVERLLLTAVAPRIVAVAGPDDAAEEPPTVLSVLQRAGAPTVQGGATRSGRVVPFAPSQRVPGPSAVGQAGA
jgi:hypothetical protein